MPRFIDISGAAPIAAAADVRAAIGALSQVEIENLIGNYEQETLDLIARMETRPDADRRDAIDTLIASLKSSGVWDKLDNFYVFAAANEQAALLNWVADARNCVAYNSPTFTADEGFTGDGATSYVATESFSGSGLNMASGDESMGIWIKDNVIESVSSIVLGTSSTGVGGTSPYRYINPRNTNPAISWKMNFSSTQGSGHTLSNDEWITQSRDATDGYLWLNGAQDDTTTQAVVDDTQSLVLYLVLGRAGAATFSTRQFSAAYTGSNLTSGEQTNFYNALATYMTAVGALA